MAVPTFGVEEEFLLSDAVTHEPREDAEEIVEQARAATIDGLDHELRSAMAETGTAVSADVGTLRRELHRTRGVLTSLAAERGAIVLASGTHPTARAARVGYPDDDRYQRMAATFGRLADEALVCGCHVHVHVPAKAAGVQVIDRIGGWLPLLLAISANSPFWEGHDTQFDSWRARVWARWPTAGPTSAFGSVRAYDERAEALIDLGAGFDRGMLYYEARLSERYPTVEVRIADVCIDVEDVVLVAALARALVTTALRSDPGWPALPPEVRRAGGFAAARWGLGGKLLDPVESRAAPAADVLHRLLAEVEEALAEAGDDQLAVDGIRRVLDRGNGAAQQRSAWNEGGQAALFEAVTVAASPART